MVRRRKNKNISSHSVSHRRAANHRGGYLAFLWSDWLTWQKWRVFTVSLGSCYPLVVNRNIHTEICSMYKHRKWDSSQIPSKRFYQNFNSFSPFNFLFPSLHFLFSLTKVNLTLDVLDEWSVERQPQWLTIHWSFLLQRAEVTLSHNPLQKEHLKWPKKIKPECCQKIASYFLHVIQ